MRAPVLLALAFGAVAVLAFWLLPGVDDEGYLTFIGARTFDVAPEPTLFFQKLHPLISLFYAPVALLGWKPFLLAHIAVAAAGVYLMGAAVQRLGGRGWLASAALATSPIFLAAAVLGQSDTEGVVAFALVLYLHSRGGRSALAGAAIAGACLWTRYEFSIPLAFIVLGGALHDEHPWRRVAAAFTFPLLYGLAGAAYHHDLLWLLHYPPSITRPVAANPAYHWLSLDWRLVVEWLSELTLAVPFWVAATCIRYSRLTGIARSLYVSAGVLLGPLVVLPMLHMFFEGLGARYMLVFLPIVAACLALDPGLPMPRVRALIVVVTALVWLATPLLPVNTRVHLGVSVSPEFYEVPARLRQTGPVGRIYTNDRRLAVLLHWSHPDLPAVLLPHHDVLVELYRLTNHDNGQYGQLMKALRTTLYGGAVWPCSLGAVDSSDRFVFDGDPRLYVLYPESYWQAYTAPVAQVGKFSIRRPRPGITRLPVPPLPTSVPPTPIVAACR